MTSLAHLERQILDLHGGLSLRPSLEKAVKLGEFLSEVKQSLPHGEFLPWVRRLPFTPRTAQTYILCFQHSGNAKFPSHLTIDGFVRWVRKATRRTPAPAPDRLARIVPSASVYRGDCRTFSWPGECDVIAADPPWLEHEHYDWLGEFAGKHLRPGGLAFVQCGVMDLADRLGRLTKSGHLRYCWTLAVVYEDVKAFKPVGGFAPAWRPVVVLSRGEREVSSRPLSADVFTVRNREVVKTAHPWQQPLEPFVHWWSRIVVPGSRFFVPFVGSGTEMLAALHSGGTAVGTEIDSATLRIARKRCREWIEQRSAEIGS
ncbi:MAG: DUF3102 domain-containing protein [Planctomycetes bacterium]|nr:DUF3102 domain-containing protein [Planctomycetota bacterium]